MALFEKDDKKSNEYIALLDATGETLLAFISPVKQIKPEVLLAALQEKGLNAEIRQSSAEITSVKL